MDTNGWSWMTSFSGFGGQGMEAFGFFQLVSVLGVSLACSVFIAFLFARMYGTATGSMVHRSFILLGPAITAVFICIQFSLPLSLGLLGALSIVRFRTPIKEPLEIGFIMVIVATSLACATFNMMFLGGILLIVLLGLLILKYEKGFLRGHVDDGMLIVTLPREEYKSRQSDVHKLLQDKLPGGRIDSISENAEDSIISYSFSRLRPDQIPDLHELEEVSDRARYNLFFHRSPGM